MKIIITNCPNYDNTFSELQTCNVNTKDCENCEECLLQKVVKLCMDSVKTYNNEEFYDDDRDIFIGESIMAENILELFDIKTLDK